MSLAMEQQNICPKELQQLFGKAFKKYLTSRMYFLNSTLRLFIKINVFLLKVSFN